MKKFILILLAIGASSPIGAMGKKSTKSSNQSSENPSRKPSEGFLEKYIDIGDLIINIGRAYKHKKKDTATATIALFDAINLENLPVRLEDRDTTVGEFFETDELKICFSEFIAKWFNGKLKKRHIADVLEGIQGSMKRDAVKDEFGDEEWLDIEKCFELLIARFSGEDVGDISEVIDLENTPAIFGFILKDYFLLDKLNEAFTNALNNKPPTKSTLLDCLDIEQIAEREGYYELPNTDGIREFIELLFSFLEDDTDATHKVFEILGVYRATKNVAEEPSSKDSEEIRKARRKDAKKDAAKKPTVRSSSSGNRSSQAARSSSSRPLVNSGIMGAGDSVRSSRARARQEQIAADESLARALQDEL